MSAQDDANRIVEQNKAGHVADQNGQNAMNSRTASDCHKAHQNIQGNFRQAANGAGARGSFTQPGGRK